MQRGAKDLAVLADQRGSVHHPARVGEGAGNADADRSGAAEQRIVVVARRGVTLHQDLAPEGIVVLHRVGSGIEKIGIAADDLAVAEYDDAATLADAPILQVD